MRSCDAYCDGGHCSPSSTPDEDIETPASLAIIGQDLATLRKFTHILLRSTLLARFVDRLPGVWSQGMAVELWNNFRILEMFHPFFCGNILEGTNARWQCLTSRSSQQTPSLL